MERGVNRWAKYVRTGGGFQGVANARADLRAWQEIAEWPGEDPDKGGDCATCPYYLWPCPHRLLADAAIDRASELCGTP